ncbi:MAG: universal stress protein [Planctomycetes bacterium]|nr:universal stress protein [Planctomycetota bacterium]
MPKFEKILCPVDFSPDSQVALQYAADLAQSGGGELTVLHVVEPILYPVEYGMAPVPAVDLESTATANARGKLDELVEAIVAEGVRAATRVVFGRADQQICDVAREGRFDLIVLATHGLTGLKHLLLGSVAERVVRHADCPVLTVKRRG